MLTVNDPLKRGNGNAFFLSYLFQEAAYSLAFEFFHAPAQSFPTLLCRFFSACRTSRVIHQVGQPATIHQQAIFCYPQHFDERCFMAGKGNQELSIVCDKQVNVR